MAAIEFQGLNKEFTTPSLSEATAQAAPSSPSLERSALLSRVAWRYDNAQRLNRYTRLSDLVISALNRRVGALETAASRLAWPTSGTPNGGTTMGARLVTPGDADASAKSLLSAELRAGSEASTYYKYFSNGRSAWFPTDLAGHDYTFTMTQSGKSADIDVSVPEGATWGETLQLTADAINASPLPAQAEVLNQPGAYNKVDFLSKTGAILAITTDPARTAQDITIQDTQGRLTKGIGLEAVSKPLGAAALGRHTVRDATPASAGTYVSDLMNPEGSPGVSAGEHRLRLSVDGEAVDVPVSVDAGMTWEELLERTAQSINLTDDRVTARVVEGRMSSGQLEPLAQRAVALEVALDSPKLGQRLSVGEYGGPWLDDIDGFHDPTNGLPTWATGDERYVASATANGWIEGHVYEHDGATSTWTDTAPTATNAVTDADGQDWFYDGGVWSATASGTLSGALGLNATATPGADATALIDGRDRTSASGLFSLDRGRLAVAVDAPAGEAQAVRVQEGFGQVEDGLADVVGAYNDLRSFLMSHADLFEAGFTDTWRDPVRDLGAELSWLGIKESAGSGELTLDRGALHTALMGDTLRAEAALVGNGGLLPGLDAASAFSRTPSLEDHLVQPALLVDKGPSPVVEGDLAERSGLQAVVEAATDAPRPESSPFEDYASVLEDIIRRKRESLAATSITGDTGWILGGDV